MPLALIMLDTRFRSRKTDQVLGHELMTHEALLGGSSFDVPARGDVHGQHGLGGLDDAGQHGVEGCADGRFKAEAEQGVDDEVCGFQGRGEFFLGAEERDV